MKLATLASLALSLTLFAAPILADAADAPTVKAKVMQTIPGTKLSLDCILSAPVNMSTLKKMADEIYMKHDGPSYENVFIMWYLPSYKIGAGAWGTSKKQGKSAPVVSEIMRLQEMQRIMNEPNEKLRDKKLNQFIKEMEELEK